MLKTVIWNQMRYFIGFNIWLLVLLSSIHIYGQNEDKLFTKLNPAQTNIHFNNEVKDTREHNILIYSNFYGGAGVGVGDINNDGLLDVFFAGNQVPDKLYLNKGNLTFEDITDKAGIIDNGGWSSGVLFGDVDNDGFQDIYVTRELYDHQPEIRRNKLYINNGDNTFSEKSKDWGVDNSERTRHATFLDYDKDGDLDLFLLNQPPNPGDYSDFKGTDLSLEKYGTVFYENNGTKFVDISKKTGVHKTGFPNSVTASDLNNDGWTDLYVANDFWIKDYIYLNNGDGTFTDKVDELASHISFSSMGVDVGDIDNDGNLDVMVLDMVAEDNFRLKSHMSGMNPETFWKVVNDGGHYQYMFNTFHYNNGDAHFSDIAQLTNMASTDWSWSNLIADFDNDGWKDVFITNGLLYDIRNTDAARAFSKHIESSVYKYLQENPATEDITVWDIVDIEKTMNINPSVKLSNYAYKNNKDLTFEKKTKDWGLDQKTFSNGSAYADLDNDGDLDLIINNVNDVALLYRNNAENKLNSNYIRIKPIADKPGVVELGTRIWVETESQRQLFEITSVRGMYSTSEQVAHFGLYDKTKVDTITVIWPDGNKNVLKNVKAGQTVEVRYSQSKAIKEPSSNEQLQTYFTNVTHEIGLNISHKENQFDDYTKQELLPHKMSTMGPALAVGDVNGDSLDDFYIGGASGEEGRIFIQNPKGGFETLTSQSMVDHLISEDVGAVFFDADGDKDLDLYVVSGGNEFIKDAVEYKDRLYLNNGTGIFEHADQALPALYSSGSKVYPHDLDGDGDLDLFVAGRQIPWSYPEPASSAILLNENGKFTDVTSTMANDLIEIGMVNDANWTDFDGDGKKDLVLVGEWMEVTLLKYDNGQFINVTNGSGLENSTGWWFSIESKDMDNDGDQDFVAGNLGLNYKYKASENEPFEVYYDDFDNNGSKDIVLAYYNFGAKYPLRGYVCSTSQVPAIKGKFKKFEHFAAADVFEVYGKRNLERALHYQAKTFASAYIENLGNGKFSMHPLPMKAQFSSINDIMIKDYNEDGHLDILIAGNLYNAEIETARNDAGKGLLMFGDGKGNFEAISKNISGFFAPYNVKVMKSIMIKDEPHIIIGCNDDRLQIIKDKGK